MKATQTMMAKIRLPKSLLPGLLALLFVLGMTSELQAQKRYRVGYKDSGFSGIVEGAVLIPSNTYDLAYNMDVILGAQLNANFFVGAGVGIDSYESDLFSSIFADVRYFFMAEQVSPFFFLDAGYAIPIDVSPLIQGGPMINPGVGLKIFFSRTFALNLSLGYRFQSMPIDSDITGSSTSLRTNWIQSPNLRLGIQF